MNSFFSIGLFFVVFRETLEVSIIVSVLLAFIDRLSLPDGAIVKRLRRSVWLGTLFSTGIVACVGAAIITVWYKYGTNLFSSSELLYEGIFGMLASIFLTITSFAFLRGQQMYEKMNRKLASKFKAHNDTADAFSSNGLSSNKVIDGPENTEQSLNNDLVKSGDSTKAQDLQMNSPQVFFWVPFITVVREGIETILLIGAPTAIPLAAVSAILLGSLVGLAIHRASGKLSIHWFFVTASYILLLMAAGIFSRSVGFFEDNTWHVTIGLKDDDAGTPQFDPRNNIWYLSCCSEKTEAGFGFLFSLFGYRSVATVGTIVSYISYWVAVILLLGVTKYRIASKSTLLK